jgi:phosphoribosylaminoimidazole carboxylase (NCAIR synthetase)
MATMLRAATNAPMRRRPQLCKQAVMTTMLGEAAREKQASDNGGRNYVG